MDPISLSSWLLHLSFHTLTSAYQLLNNTLPGVLENAGCASPQIELITATSATTLPPLPLLPFVYCSEPNITTASYRPHISLFDATDYFNSTGTHFVGTLEFSDCNDTLTLSTSTQPLSLNVHNATILCGTQIYCCLPGWSGTCALVFIYAKLGVAPREEFLLVPITSFIVEWHNKWAV